MHYRKLGRTGLMVSEIGFGAWAIGGAAQRGGREIGWGKLDDATSVAALEAALDAGINFYDTANTYGLGHSEERIGKAFSSKRDDVIICSKVGNRLDADGKDFSRKGIEREIEGSLRRLRTDHLDVYLAHSPKVPEELPPDWSEVFEDLKAAGKTRFYGISIGPSEDGVWMIRGERGDVLQVVYNVLARAPETVLFPLAQEEEIGIIARVPLASGFLSGKYSADSTFPEADRRRQWSREQIAQRAGQGEKARFLEIPGKRTMAQAALRFCLAHPAVSTVIPGAKNPQQALENAAASDAPALTDAELERISAL